MGIEHLGWFVLAGWVLNLTPGPDVLFIVTSAGRGGMRTMAWLERLAGVLFVAFGLRLAMMDNPVSH